MRNLKILLPVLFLLSCHRPAMPVNADREAIQRLLERERKAHVDRNTDLFVSGFSDSLLSVSKGRVRLTPPDSMRGPVQAYFDQVEFVSWDDTAPPIIRFSPDRQLAYAIVQKRVIVQDRTDSSGKKKDTTDFAWASVYRKTEGEWKLEANISTNR